VARIADLRVGGGRHGLLAAHDQVAQLPPRLHHQVRILRPLRHARDDLVRHVQQVIGLGQSAAFPPSARRASA